MRRGAVLVVIPYFKCSTYIRQSVESVLGQTHSDVQVVVVNDADPEPPWKVLDDIRDPRLWRVELPRNNGPYFAVECVARTATAPYLMIQDADDWSDPSRASTLLEAAERTGAGFVSSAQRVHHSHRETDDDGRPYAVRDEDLSARARQGPSDRFLCRGLHHGLFRARHVRRLGGYFGGFRVSYDALLVSVSHRLGEQVYLNDRLYHRRRRLGSLTTNPETALGSAYRESVVRQLAAIYSDVVESVHQLGEQAEPALLMQRHVSDADQLRLEAWSREIGEFVKTPTDHVLVVGS